MTMPQTTLKSLFPLLVLLIGAGFAAADEGDELHRKAETMRREARELVAAGDREEAEQVERAAHRLLEEAAKLAHRHDGRKQTHALEIAELHQRLTQLHREQREALRRDGKGERAADLRREMEKVQGRLRELMQQPSRPTHHRPGPDVDARRRLEHLHAAIEHLQQAGLHEMAERVIEQARAVERTLEQRRPVPHPPEALFREMMAKMERLHDVVNRLQADVHRLQVQVADEDDDDDDDDDDD